MSKNNRKRSRSGEDCNDCMPISKRINGLHIQYGANNDNEDNNTQILNNNLPQFQGVQGQGQSLLPSSSDTSQKDLNFYPNDIAGSSSNSQMSIDSLSQNEPRYQNSFHNGIVNDANSQSEVMKSNSDMSNSSQNINKLMEELQVYKPELSEMDNPHYYEINQVLFNIHKERCLRRMEDR